MFEHIAQPLLSRGAYLLRIVRHALAAVLLVAAALGLGVFGYHYTEGLSWIDALVNASMLLGGMGPVNPLYTVAGKLFASAYALFAGLVFLLVAGVVFAPVVHRFLHKLHLDADDK